MSRFGDTDFRSDISIFDSVIFGGKETIADPSQARKVVPGNYIHVKVSDYRSAKTFHLVYHEDCCMEKIAKYIAFCQPFDLHDKNLSAISFSEEDEDNYIWLASGETRIKVCRHWWKGDILYAFVLTNSQGEGFAWAFGEAEVKKKKKSDIPSCFKRQYCRLMSY